MFSIWKMIYKVAMIEEILAFTRNDVVFSDYYGNLFSSDDVSDLIHRVRKSYAANTGNDLDFYAFATGQNIK